MGYSTFFKISVEGKPFNQKELDEIKLLKAQAAQLNPQLKKVALDGIAQKEKRVVQEPEQLIKGIIGFNPFEESCKWYDYEKDMKAVSKKYPTTIFILEGEGEESGDIWKAYFLDGKMQKCKAKIIFDEFDESKLI
jgi:hypothetical protein